ncbi:MAG: T9SS type A sorting domain-containing protein [Balneolaceae bacterium]|nr:T9SS type A sorting domain-containing protein [Balneolaceae bacterium]MBO6545094.1 T9SS type A sorting domain-containing protein [Balneolaceae bacterium]MBO6646490.1 T9SS type A sorting domain-containing protein [Balneolaceae bacterium]
MKKSYHVIIVLLFASSPLFAQVDYETQIQTIFNARCTNCHGANGGVDLSSFNSLMSSVGNAYGDRVVVAFEPDSSGLVDKIEPSPMFGSRMPQGGMLDQSDIDLIRQWISEGASAVPASNEGESLNPEEFKLLGNYPNPFNPGTQILFDVPVATQYTVSIYSINGQLITEQVGNASAGRVQVSVNLGANPSGMYFYRVSAQMNGATRLIGTGQMTLIK